MSAFNRRARGDARESLPPLQVDLPNRSYLESSGITAKHAAPGISYTEAEVDELAAGPFAIVPHTQEVCIKYTSAFKWDENSHSAGLTSTVEFASLYAGLTSAIKTKVAKYNRRNTLPISLRVLGATVGMDKSKGLEDHFHFSLLDKSGKSLGARFAGADKSGIGFPLHLLRHDSAASALEKPPSLLDDHRQYWHISLRDLVRDVEILKMPGERSSEEYVLIKRDSISALLCHYALSVKNHEIEDLLSNEQFFFENNPDIIKVPKELFDDVYEAYKNKLSEVQKTSFDISELKAILVPLQGSKDILKQKQLILTGEPAYVTFELKVWIPIKDTATNLPVLTAQTLESLVPYHEGDDDDANEDLARSEGTAQTRRYPVNLGSRARFGASEADDDDL
jgi:hypothetical protein